MEPFGAFPEVRTVLGVGEMDDLLVVGITIVIFAVFFLIVKGAERIER